MQPSQQNYHHNKAPEEQNYNHRSSQSLDTLPPQQQERHREQTFSDTATRELEKGGMARKRILGEGDTEMCGLLRLLLNATRCFVNDTDGK